MKTRRLAIAACVTTAAAVWLAAPRARAAELAIGAEVPGFELPSTAGEFDALERSPGKKGSVILFWSNTCPAVRKCEPYVVSLANEFQPKGFAFIAINGSDYLENKEESFERMKQRAASAKYPFPYVQDTTQAVVKAWKVKRTPTVFVVGPDRRLLYRGALLEGLTQTEGPGYLRPVLESLAAGEPLKFTTTDVWGSPVSLNPTLIPRRSGGTLAPKQAITPFALLGVDGQMYIARPPLSNTLTAYVFWCNSCPVVKAYEDRVIELARKFAGRGGVDFVLINSNDPKIKPEDSFEKMKQRAKEKGYPCRYLFDHSQQVARDFGATCTPHVFLVDRFGIVQYEGAIDDNQKPAEVQQRYLDDAAAAYLSGGTISPASTDQFGCSIKWRSAAGAAAEAE